MPMGEVFWGLFIFGIIFGAWGNLSAAGAVYWTRGSWLFIAILIGLLGWHDFGAAVR